MYPDLDEVADGLLVLLGFQGTVAEPCTPTEGSPGILMQRYDITKSLNELERILQQHHHEMRTTDWNESGLTVYSIWVRKKVA